jgi:hypothetical protein
MNSHPYLRAYMAGVVVPSVALLIALTVFIVTRLVFNVPVPIERAIIFPMAVIPNAFGLWNMLYVWSRPHRNLPIGLHGALLPWILISVGGLGAVWVGFLEIGAQGLTWFGVATVPYSVVVVWFLTAVVLYYLVWKHIVGFLNQLLGIA